MSVLASITAYAGLIAVLMGASLKDIRERRISNATVAAVVVLWLAWRCCLIAMVASDGRNAVFASPIDGLGYGAAAAPLAAFGDAELAALLVAANSVSALFGALVFGFALLVFTVVVERVFKKEMFGGGDIKLLAVIDLFFGIEKMLGLLFVSCIISLVFAIASDVLPKSKEVSCSRKPRIGALKRKPSLRVLPSKSGNRTLPDGENAQALPDAACSGIPFAPCIACAALLILLAC